MTLKAGNFYAIEAHSFGGTASQKPSTKITYGVANNVHEIYKKYRQITAMGWSAHTFILLYVNSDTTLTITHSNYTGAVTSTVFLLS